jgi:hypothetical protein
MAAGLPGIVPAQAFADSGGWRLRLRFQALSLWDHDALVARLEPADRESMAGYDHLVARRQSMDGELVKLGKEPLHEWRPHVSIAYFAKKDLAAEALALLPEWDRAFRTELAGHVIEFSAFDLGCFLDMTSFFLAPHPDR